MALSQIRTVNPEDIKIIRRIGSGLDGNVFEAEIASFANGKAVALKIYKEYQLSRFGCRRSKAGFEPSPFEIERMAYSVIQSDPEAAANLPVIEAYFWFEIPARLRIGRYRLSSDKPLKAIVKRLGRAPPLNFKLVDPEQMIEHRRILDRLQIFVLDIREDNFVEGRLADLAAAYYLEDRMCPDRFNKLDQSLEIKLMILRDQGILLEQQSSNEPIEREWQDLVDRFRCDPTRFVNGAFKMHIQRVNLD